MSTMIRAGYDAVKAMQTIQIASDFLWDILSGGYYVRDYQSTLEAVTFNQAPRVIPQYLDASKIAQPSLTNAVSGTTA